MKLLAVVVILFVSTACTATMNTNDSERSADVAHAMEALSTTRVFFAHQSVGANIVDGMQALKAEGMGPNLRVMELAASDQLGNGFFAHAKLGTNGDPKGKTDAFA